MMFRQFIAWAVLIGVLVGGYVCYQYRDETFFPITKVKIKGDFYHVSRGEMTETISPFLSLGFFGVLPTKIQALLERKPWIKEAHVRRMWPDILEVVIVERKPLFQFNSNLLVDADGEAFVPHKTKVFDELPQLSARGHFSPQLLQEYKKISKILNRVGLFIKKLERTDATLTMVMRNGMTLVASYPSFGREIERFVIVYPSIKGKKQAHLAKIDLRYQHGMAVSWK